MFSHRKRFSGNNKSSFASYRINTYCHKYINKYYYKVDLHISDRLHRETDIPGRSALFPVDLFHRSVVSMPLTMVIATYFAANVSSSSNDSLHRPLFVGETWLIAYSTSYASGMTLRRHRPTHAAAVLNWVSKPSLLLAVLLYATIGLCLNGYAFTIDPRVPVAAALLPAAGYTSVFTTVGIRWMVNRLRDAAAGRHGRRHGRRSRRRRRRCSFAMPISNETIATETATSNCLLTLVVLRFSLADPDCDVASSAAIWISLMITLVPVVACLPAVARRKCAEWKKDRSTCKQLIAVGGQSADGSNVDYGRDRKRMLNVGNSAASLNVLIERVTVV